MDKVLRATHGSADKPLRIGDLEIPCYVLEDGTRVLSGRGMQTALALGQRHGTLLKSFLGRDNIQPFISKALAMALSNPLRFIRPGRGGKVAVGYEATMLPEICDALLSARGGGVLTPKQLVIAEQCEMLTRAFAKVGIIALVDEATGYQEVRDRLALQAILDKFLTQEKAKWAKTFPDEFYEQIFRLRGWEFKPLTGKRPALIGHLTNDIVYSRLAPGILHKLQDINPKTDRGIRKDRHHQFFTRDYGFPELKLHILNLIFLMRGSDTWKTFSHLLNRAAPKYGDTMDLDFPTNEEQHHE
jgi:P63C domain.